MSLADRAFDILRAASDRSRQLLSASKRARKVRRADEFNVRDLTPTMRAPIFPLGAYSWDLDAIRDARDAQMIGRFQAPARLAESMRTDDALAVAYKVRLAPIRCIGVEIQPAKGKGADIVASEADALFGPEGVGIKQETLNDIEGCLANHGVAFGVNIWTPRPDGSRVDVELRAWPIEFVWHNQAARCFMTRIDPFPGLEMSAYGFLAKDMVDPYGSAIPAHGNNVVPILHGDGRWVVFTNHEHLPFRQDAAILPGALVWAAHAFSQRDWNKGSASHGNAKVVGTMPAGVSLQGKDEAGFEQLTAEAAALLTALEAVASQDQPVVIKPAGSELDYLVNDSQAWEVWAKLGENREKAAARIYCGTDALLGAQGGAPGVDIAALFGVSTTIVSGDLGAIERGARTGTIEPWTAVNHGDSSLAPTRRYMIPDPNDRAVREAFAKRTSAFFADLKAAKENNIIVDQQYVNDLAAQHNVPKPTLANAQPGASWFAYEVDAGIPTINEVRKTKGEGPHPNGRGDMTVPEALAAAEASKLTPAAPSAAAPAVPAAPIAESVASDTPAPGDEPEESDAARLAAKMSELGIERCQHGAVNRCRLCGVERERDVSLGPDGQPVWAVKWKAIAN